MSGIQVKLKQWLSHQEVSLEDKNFLTQLTPQSLDDSFFKEIEFGTAGMRGVMGPGTNRINTFTIKKAVVAYGMYLKTFFPNALDKGVVIAHDNRHQAQRFTDICVSVLNQMGINTHTFHELVPTPLLSFTIRELQAIGGIMITASHNPKEYNGFKIYDEFGCQLIPSKIDHVINNLATLGDVLSLSVPSSANLGQTHQVSPDVEKKYLSLVLSLQLRPALNKKDFKVVFTPQHGASYRLVPELFKTMGYSLHVVQEQMTLDPDFSGTKSPNPEEPKAYHKAILLAKKIKADLIMVADPDADRVGLAYLNRGGQYELLNGNLSAALLVYYMLNFKKDHSILPVNGVMYDTIVSSPLAKKIALSFGIRVESFLTGFKFIGERIQLYKEQAGPSFIFGYEESYGCLIGDFVRDKDAVQALTMYAEMALYYHGLGKTLDVVLEEIFQLYGYHHDVQFSLALSGNTGQSLLESILLRLRKAPFKPIGNIAVIKVDDYLTQLSKTNNESFAIALPKANVIKYYLADGSTIVVRPSGTEPKCKFYFSIVSLSNQNLEQKVLDLKKAFYELYDIKEV
jgi:phosphoglucomutase